MINILLYGRGFDLKLHFSGRDNLYYIKITDKLYDAIDLNYSANAYKLDQNIIETNRYDVFNNKLPKSTKKTKIKCKKYFENIADEYILFVKFFLKEYKKNTPKTPNCLDLDKEIIKILSDKDPTLKVLLKSYFIPKTSENEKNMIYNDLTILLNFFKTTLIKFFKQNKYKKHFIEKLDDDSNSMLYFINPLIISWFIIFIYNNYDTNLSKVTFICDAFEDMDADDLTDFNENLVSMDYRIQKNLKKI